MMKISLMSFGYPGMILGRLCALFMNLHQLRLRIEKIYRWEFWPMNVFLVPVYVYYVCLALRAWNLGWYRYVNPSMPFSGLQVGKKHILDFFDPALVPQTELFTVSPIVAVHRRKTELKTILRTVKNNFALPIIAKPDRGCRGASVEKITTWGNFKIYLASFSGELLIQEYVDLPLEFGVFYVRIPGQKTGKITSLMERKFLAVMGDGVSDLATLIARHDRAKFYSDYLENRYVMTDVLPAGSVKRLGSIGNHCRGTIFADANNAITDKLTGSIDRVSKQMPDFYYGRYDIRCASFAALERGEFQIIELNGFFSEPGHVYDPGNKIWYAYRDYFAHYRMMFEVYRRIEKKLPKMSLREQWGILF